MKKKWFVSGALVLSVLVFTACGKKQEENAEVPDPGAVIEEAEKGADEPDAKA